MTGESRDDVAVTSVRLARERRELLGRIRERVRTMFEDGLREEVERLLAGGYGPGDPGLRAIGYREFFTSTGELRPAGEDETIAGEIAANTRRYAKRQETFFRQLPDVVDVRTGGTGADGGQALNVASVGGECGPEWVVGLVERLCGELDSA
jgi:tRNA A37 N6-isopentenylltransferase MiaA